MVRISVIGPLTVESSGPPTLTFRTKSVARIIGLLAIRSDRQWLRSEIASLLWPEADDHNARQNLRQNLVFVRRILGDALIAEGELIGLNEGHWISDFIEFKNRTRPSAGPQTLADALALVRGELLAGLDDPWIIQARSEFDKQVAAVRQRVEQGALNRVIRIRQPLHDLHGRHKEIRDAASLLLDPESRAFTITGQIGIGKTSVALAAVSRWHAEVISGESAILDVSEIQTEQELATRLLCAFELGYVKEGSIESALSTRISELPAVVIFDAISTQLCESGAIQSILTHAPSLKIICTSRQVQQSLPFPTIKIEPLPVPGPDANVSEVLATPAVQILTDELAKVGWDKGKASTTDIRSIQSIARLVEGNPVALQLAARLYLEMSLSEIQARLPEESLQTTIVSMIDSELVKLSELERQIIESASVLGEYWSLKTLSELMELCGISLPINSLRTQLGNLTRISLLEIKDSEGIRYWKLPHLLKWQVHSTMGQAKLNDLCQLRLKLIDTILSSFPDSRYADPGLDWRLEMEQYTSLLLETARQLIKTSPSDSVRIAAFLPTYLVTSSMLWEARDILSEALKGNLEPLDRATALEGKARFDITLSAYTDARNEYEHAEKIYASLGCKTQELHCRVMQAHVNCHIGELVKAREIADDILASAELPETIYEARMAQIYHLSVLNGTREEIEKYFDDALSITSEFAGATEYAVVLAVMATMPQYSHVEKVDAIREAITHFELAQYPYGLASVLGSYGRLIQDSHPEDARTALQRAVAVSRSIRHERELCINLNYLGDIEQILGNYQEAEEAYVEIVRIKRTSHTLAGLRTPLRSLGVLRIKQKRYAEALACLQESDDLSRYFKLDGIDLHICSPHIATALWEMGRKEEAMKVAKESYEFLSNFPEEFVDSISFDGPELVPMLRQFLAKAMF